MEVPECKCHPPCFVCLTAFSPPAPTLRPHQISGWNDLSKEDSKAAERNAATRLIGAEGGNGSMTLTSEGITRRCGAGTFQMRALTECDRVANTTLEAGKVSRCVTWRLIESRMTALRPL